MYVCNDGSINFNKIIAVLYLNLLFIITGFGSS